MKLWDKGISIDKKIEQFTVGNDREVDVHIAKYDVIASRAHAKMLQKIGILTTNELIELLGGLKKIETQIDNGTFVIEPQFEDVHSKIEFELTKTLGEVGKKNTYRTFKKRPSFSSLTTLLQRPFKHCKRKNKNPF